MYHRVGSSEFPWPTRPFQKSRCCLLPGILWIYIRIPTKGLESTLSSEWLSVLNVSKSYWLRQFCFKNHFQMSTWESLIFFNKNKNDDCIITSNYMQQNVLTFQGTDTCVTVNGTKLGIIVRFLHYIYIYIYKRYSTLTRISFTHHLLKLWCTVQFKHKCKLLLPISASLLTMWKTSTVFFVQLGSIDRTTTDQFKSSWIILELRPKSLFLASFMPIQCGIRVKFRSMI